MISIDPPEELKKMQADLGLGFPTLMDPGSETIKRYGILNEKQGRIPHPTALVIDKKGIIRYRRVDEDYKQRPLARELLEALKGA